METSRRTYTLSIKALEALKRIQNLFESQTGGSFSQEKTIEKLILENDPDKKKEAK